jgi:hypothetical protein
MASKTRRSTAAAVVHKEKARSGKGTSGHSFSPTEVPRVAMGADLQYDRPRPSPTRYPIDQATFLRLKERARKLRMGATAKRASTIVADRGTDATEPAPAAVAEQPGVPLAAAPTAAPTALVRFPGLDATGWLPPDCTMAVGPNHVLVSVNSSAAVYAKSGGAPALSRTLSAWFAGVIADAKIFDPKALYDQHAGRWVLVALALGPESQGSYFLISISQTSDPLGAWWNYKLDASRDGQTPTNNWADYPSVGVDSQALYLTANMFQFNGNFAYAKVRVVPKTAPYAGGVATYSDIVRLQNADGSFAFTVQPCHTYGASTVEYLVNSVYPSQAGTQNTLTLWSLTNPLASPALARRSVTTSPFSLPPDADQRGGGTPLDTGDVRVLNAINRGGSIWCVLTTVHDYGAGNVAAVHWFEINATSGGLTQQGIYGSRATHTFYPAVMPDSNGNVFVVFSRASKQSYGALRYTGRRAADPLGTLRASAAIRAGVANYTGLDSFGRNRWGDYAGIGADPADPLKVWGYGMYAAGANQWGTEVGAMKF